MTNSRRSATFLPTRYVPPDTAFRAFGTGATRWRRSSSPSSRLRLVVLDLRLPYMSGKDVLARIRLGRRVPDVPVVVITRKGCDRGVPLASSGSSRPVGKADCHRPPSRDDRIDTRAEGCHDDALENLF